MPQESTSEPAELLTKYDRAFAESYSAQADLQLAHFDALVLRLRVQMNEAKQQRSEQMLTLALAAFLLAVEQLLTNPEPLLAQITARYLSRDWPNFRSEPWIDVTELRVVSEQVRRLVNERQQRLEIETEQTGLTVVELAPQSMLGPSEVTAVRKALDAANTRAVQQMVFTVGITIPRKIAVPTIDNRTTDLCRNRMAYQVRFWNEYFVDPETQARWLFPPFVGGGLPAKESWHYCRSVMLPLGE